jgi:hypothetical protein
MKNCREVAEALFAFVEGVLEKAHCDGLSEHICRCPPCAALVETYRVTIRLTRRLPPAPMPPELVVRLSETVTKAAREA